MRQLTQPSPPEQQPRSDFRVSDGDSNPRPPGPQPGALPTELRPPCALNLARGARASRSETAPVGESCRPATASASSSDAISSALKPAAPSTSSVFSPSSGARLRGARWPPGEADREVDLAHRRVGAGVPRSRSASRARRAGSTPPPRRPPAPVRRSTRARLRTPPIRRGSSSETRRVSLHGPRTRAARLVYRSGPRGRSPRTSCARTCAPAPRSSPSRPCTHTASNRSARSRRATGTLPSHQIAAHQARDHRQHPVGHRDVDELALPGGRRARAARRGCLSPRTASRRPCPRPGPRAGPAVPPLPAQPQHPTSAM